MNSEMFQLSGRPTKLMYSWLMIAAIVIAIAIIASMEFLFIIAVVFVMFANLSYCLSSRPRELVIEGEEIIDRDSNAVYKIPHLKGVWSNGSNFLNETSLKRTPGKKITLEFAHNKKLELIDHDESQIARLVALLISRCPPRTEPLPSSLTDDYYRTHLAKFSKETVFGIRAASEYAKPKTYQKQIAKLFGLHFFFVGIFALILCVAVFKENQRLPILITGLLLTIPGLILLLFSTVSKVSNSKNLQGCAIAISPIGFALSQRDLNGDLLWSQVKSIKIAGGCLHVSVPGAAFRILNIYEIDIRDIKRLMEMNLAGAQ